MSKPTKCVSVQTARDLQNNWVATRQPEIDRALGYTDAREVFYSVEELEEFLNYVKSESKKQGITNPGIRIYFGAYNDVKSNKATLFLAPTTGDDKNSDNNYSIEALNDGTQGWPPKNY
ncbi:MAG: hypothetical protein NXH73_02660 [Flavobacteriaceae bacterium]|nr:hypothetical protein [Flavobacteriaceae bacterium]